MPACAQRPAGGRPMLTGLVRSHPRGPGTPDPDLGPLGQPGWRVLTCSNGQSMFPLSFLASLGQNCLFVIKRVASPRPPGHVAASLRGLPQHPCPTLLLRAGVLSPATQQTHPGLMGGPGSFRLPLWPDSFPGWGRGSEGLVTCRHLAEGCHRELCCASPSGLPGGCQGRGVKPAGRWVLQSSPRSRRCCRWWPGGGQW